MSSSLRGKDGATISVEARGQGQDWIVQSADARRVVQLLEHDAERIVFALDGKVHRAYVRVTSHDVRVVLGGREVVFQRQATSAGTGAHAADAHEPVLRAPVPGRVLKVNIEAGATIQAGDVLVVIEAMKMETPVVAPADGKVAEIHATSGELVEQDQPLVTCSYG